MSDTKACTKCGKVKPLTEFNAARSRSDGRMSSCRECRREDARQYREANREKVRETNRDYASRHRAANREEGREYSRLYREANREKVREGLRQWRDRVRDAVLDHYGRVCACPGCGATDDLTIDHVDGGGRAHREELFGRGDGSTRLYHWLVANGFPDGFQTLCGTCNRSKFTGAACRIDHGTAAQNA